MVDYINQPFACQTVNPDYSWELLRGDYICA